MRAVVLAGGRGARLAPYTTILPKPLMPIGEMPILEIVLRQLAASGITDVTLAVGHLAQLLQAFFGDGARLGLCIEYSHEDKPLGTVGPLRLIRDLKETFILMNGDVLTTLDYRDLVRRHRESKAAVTIASYIRSVKVDFGVIEADRAEWLTAYIEKPSLTYRVSMGVYVFEPQIIHEIPADRQFDFPDLVNLLIARKMKVLSYPFSGYWLDIGRPDDYARAVEEFESRKEEFLPSTN